MEEFLFQVNQRVQEIASRRFGRVKHRDATGSSTGGVNVRFYDVLFEDSKDGKNERFPEQKLREAGPEPPKPK
jgi:hypothetical protein